MAKLTKSITINAPVEKVFKYVEEPTNLPEFWPSMVETKDVEPLPGGGYKFGWVYKMAGVRFEGTSKVTEYVANQRAVTVSKGGIASTITWTYEPKDGGTRLTFDAEYTVPIPLLGRLAEALIVRQNEREAETLLTNLKARMEA